MNTLESLTKNLNQLNQDNISDKPPYMTAEEWKTYLELSIDELEHPAMQWCEDCYTYHQVETT